MKSFRRSITMSLAIVALFASTHAFGDLIVDQQNAFLTTDNNVSGIGIAGFSPIGQSFTPTVNSFDSVEFRITDVLDNGLGATLDVRLRQGTITGAVIGTSASVVLPSNFDTSFGGTPVLFRFSTPISLIPNSLYTFELRTISGDNLIVLWKNPGTYGGGAAFVSGTATAGDLWFRQGLTAVPEPTSTLATLSLASAGMLYRFRHRR